MNGTKRITDGYVRKDFIGGFPGDKRSAFTEAGRTAEENDMFNWLKTVLHWRKDNLCIIQGQQKQFIPYNGIYVLTRNLGDHSTIMTIVNGANEPRTMPVARYTEVIGDADVATDVPTGRQIDLTHDITLPARGTLILDF